MNWIRTSLQLGQAVKNVQRLRVILAVFARHGFADLVERMRLGKFLPSRWVTALDENSDRTPAERLRGAFEELGPTFVKLGQLLSTRPDLVPEPFIVELVKLQDNVRPLPFDRVRAVIEKELGRKIEECFESVDENPLAAASIGQVHAAVLKTGERVVLKVQRPDIEKSIETDVSLLAFLAGLLERYVPESRIAQPKIIVEEFFRTLSLELNYVVEANNMTRIAKNMSAIPEIVVPKVYREISGQRVMVLERLEGVRVNDIAALDAAGVDRRRIVLIGAKAFFRSVMIDGLFHGDLHGGNLFVLPGNRLGIIDFGIVGRLSEKSRFLLANMVMALLNEDFEQLCYLYAEMGDAGPSIDFEAFQREVRNTIAPYLGLKLRDVNMGKVLIEATRVATRHQIKIPGDWMLVFKAILTIEGMGRTLDPGFDLVSIGQDLVKELVKNQYSLQRMSKDLMWIAKDVTAFLQVLPRQLRWMFKKWGSDDFAFEIKSQGFEDIREQLDVSSRRTSASIVVAGLMVAGAIALQVPSARPIGDYPWPALVLLGLGTLGVLRLLFRRF